jgi:HSP20 family protein
MLPSLWTSRKEIQPLSGLRDAMDRLFDNFLEEWPSFAREKGDGLAFAPAFDLKDTGDALVAEVEIPGMDQKDITVQVEGDVLSVKGERKREEEKKTESYYRKERSYGAFERQIALPASVDRDKVEAAYSNGVLQITLPKVAGSKAKVVPVKGK